MTLTSVSPSLSYNYYHTVNTFGMIEKLSDKYNLHGPIASSDDS